MRTAKEDAVAAGCGEVADGAPDGIRLDLMVEIEEQAEGLSDTELWAVAAEGMRQHGDAAPSSWQIGSVLSFWTGTCEEWKPGRASQLQFGTS